MFDVLTQLQQHPFDFFRGENFEFWGFPKLFEGSLVFKNAFETEFSTNPRIQIIIIGMKETLLHQYFESGNAEPIIDEKDFVGEVWCNSAETIQPLYKRYDEPRHEMVETSLLGCC